jgi:MSHA biogenesis protein MshM
MYLEHFNLKEFAFSLTPNTEFFLNALSYREALNTLLVALKSGDGFIKITGEVGTGKTLLCRKLLNSLGEDYEPAYIANPALSDLDIYRAVAEDLGIKDTNFANGHQLTQALTQRLIQIHREGKRVVLLIDEAQVLSNQALEAVRLLTNIETETRKLIQIVLFGQPELDERLAQPSFRQLRQRIIFSYRLKTIDKDSINGYLQHRLMVAGYEGEDLFSQAAVKMLHKASRGIPRLINVLGHKAMMVAYGKGVKSITKAHVNRAILDTEDAFMSYKTNFFKRHQLLFGILISGLIAASLLGVLL